jgi:FOG: GAF domain
MSSLNARIVPFVCLPLALVLAICIAVFEFLGLPHGMKELIILAVAALVSAAAGTMAALRHFVCLPLAALTAQIQKAAKDSFLLRASNKDQPEELAALSDAFNVALSEITTMQVAAIETDMQVRQMEGELALKAELERRNHEIEEANARLEQRVREMSMLLDVSRQLGSTLELPEILRSITEIVGTAMGADQFTVMLLENEETLTVAGSYGLHADKLTSFKLRMGEGISGIAAQTREPVYIPDVRNDARYIRGPDDPDTDSSLLCVPMICRGQFVGTLNFTRLRKDAFSDNDIVLLQLMGAQAALAVLNAQLFSQRQSAQAQ